MTSITYPSGRIVRYLYNNQGRPIKVFESGQVDYASDVSYKVHGGIDTITYGNGVQSTFTYDNRFRPTQIAATHSTLNLSWDDRSNLSTWSTGGVSRSFAYDELGRITSAGGPNGENISSYLYDDHGNRTSRTVNGTSETYNYSNNRLTSVTGGFSESYDYDTRGRMTDRGSDDFDYDPLSNLTAGRSREVEGLGVGDERDVEFLKLLEGADQVGE